MPNITFLFIILFCEVFMKRSAVFCETKNLNGQKVQSFCHMPQILIEGYTNIREVSEKMKRILLKMSGKIREFFPDFLVATLFSPLCHVEVGKMTVIFILLSKIEW